MRYCEVRGETLEKALELARRLYGDDVIYIKHREESKKGFFNKGKKEIVVEISVKEKGNKIENKVKSQDEENHPIEVLPKQELVLSNYRNDIEDKIDNVDRMNNMEKSPTRRKGHD
jgi:predicted RNA-binding protein Jag